MRSIKVLTYLITVCTLLFSCQNDMKDIMAIPEPKLRPTQQGKGVTMLYSDSAQLKMVLKAPKMQTFEKNVPETFTVLSEGVWVGFYNDDEKLETTLRANYGIHYPNRKRIEVKYDVEMVNKEGEKLNTEHLIWDQNTKRISSDAFVKITTAKQIIMGKGLESNDDFTNYQIREVTGTIQLGNEDL
jgi:LPS export ABC transporter protein LptC